MIPTKFQIWVDTSAFLADGSLIVGGKLMNNFKKILLLLKSKCKKYGIKYNVRGPSIREMQKPISDKRQKPLFDSCGFNVTNDIKGAMNIHKNNGLRRYKKMIEISE